MDLLFTETTPEAIRSSITPIVMLSGIAILLMAAIWRYSSITYYKYTYIPILFFFFLALTLAIAIYSPLAALVVLLFSYPAVKKYVPRYQKTIIIDSNTPTDKVISILEKHDSDVNNKIEAKPQQTFYWRYFKSFIPTTPPLVTAFNTLLLLIASWPIALEAYSGQAGDFGWVYILLLPVVVFIPISLIALLIKVLLLKRHWIDAYMLFCWIYFIFIIFFYATL